eukprot:3363168-Rhodomonas_salina.2
MEVPTAVQTVVACDYCGAQIEKKDLRHHQSFVCLQSEFRVMQCPKGCGQNVEARDLDKHIHEECPLELVPCDFQLSGCPRRIARRAKKEHNTENIEYHLGLINKTSTERDDRMHKLEKSLRSREMELQQLYKTLDRERDDRLEMMTQYDEKIQKLLEIYEQKMSDMAADCKKALHGSMLTASNMDKTRSGVDALTYDMQKVKSEFNELAMVVRAQGKAAAAQARSRTPGSAPGAADSELANDLPIMEPFGAPVSTMLTVNAKNGPCYTINEAMREAKVGDKIILTPGKYTESLRMTRPMQIIGEGHVSDITIETSGRD